MQKSHDQASSATTTVLISATLKKALDAFERSNRELAEKAGVSFRALAEARAGVSADEIRGSPRKRLGVVASMTRLAVFLNVEPRTVLSELQIDPSDADVQRHIERAQDVSITRPHTDDYVFRSMAARALVNPGVRPGPLVGIAPWSPFSDVDAGGASVAQLLTRSLLGSLDPEWDRSHNVSMETNFREAEKRLLDNELGSPELLVGLYDVPWRRRGKVEVATLPGLSVKVGGLCTREIQWKEVLTGRGERLPHVLVVEDDVGDRLLSGPADYPVARLINPRLHVSDSQRTVVNRIKEHVTRFQNHQGEFLFVADGPFVSKIHDDLLTQGINLRPIEGPEWAPAYRFGFAIRTDAPDFKVLVDEAISEDLLGRVFPRTAFLYLKLLTSDRTQHISLDVGELNVHPDGDKKFIKVAVEFFEESYRARPTSDSQQPNKDAVFEEVAKLLHSKTNNRASLQNALDEYKSWELAGRSHSAG